MGKRRRFFIIAFLAAFAALLPSTGLAQSDNGDHDAVFVRVNGSEVIPASRSYDVVVMVNGDIEVNGFIDTVLVVVDGNAQISSGAVVDGNVWLVNGIVTLRDGAVVTGDILLSDDAELVMETGAEHRGEVRRDTLNFDLGRAALITIVYIVMITWSVTTALTILGAIVFAGIGARQLISSAIYATKRPAGTLIAAILFWLVAGLTAFALTFTFVGIPFLIPLFAIAAMLWWLGYIVVGVRFGSTILQRPLGDPEIGRPYMAAIVGTLLLQIINLIASAGGLMLAIAATQNEDLREVAIVISIPLLLVAFALLLLGMLGGGAIIYRAVDVWRERPVEGPEHRDSVQKLTH